jgi:hypothetical protein
MNWVRFLPCRSASNLLSSCRSEKENLPARRNLPALGDQPEMFVPFPKTMNFVQVNPQPHGLGMQLVLIPISAPSRTLRRRKRVEA